MSAIVLDDLLKRVGKQRVFSNLNLEVLDGDFFSIVGLKDAGKTTLTRILMGYLKATKGSARIYDMDCYKESKEIKESVTFVPQDVLLSDNFKANSIFKKTLAAHNLKSTEDIETLSDYFQFDERKRIGDMSDRERKLFSIINALIVKPRLIILDEPTKGLTEEDKQNLFNHLRTLNRTENTTVLMLTDSLIDAKKYSKRIAYLYHGEIKDMEYVTEKLSNDKILRISNYRGNINYFTSMGAYLIKDDSEETILYYDGDLKKLSKVIYEENLENYTLENATLRDKMNAYYNDDNTLIKTSHRNQAEALDREQEPEQASHTYEKNVETEPVDAPTVTVDHPSVQIPHSQTQEEKEVTISASPISEEMTKSKLEKTQILTSTSEMEKMHQTNPDTSNYKPISSIEELTATENKDDTLLLNPSDKEEIQ